MSIESSFQPELPITEIALALNSEFSEGKSALYQHELLSKIPKPILVDFNCVLANNEFPIVGSPYAEDFLNELENIGNIVIVTAASGWDIVKEILESVNAWNNKRILMTQDTWQFAFGYGRYDHADRLRDKFIAQRHDPKITAESFTNRLYSKKVAPLFMKDYDVPLIDDMWENTHDNPGIFGIQVKPYEPLVHYGYDGSTLHKALESVRNYYQRLK